MMPLACLITLLLAKARRTASAAAWGPSRATVLVR